MTREEAIIILDCKRPYGNRRCAASDEEIEEALGMAISALKQANTWIPYSERQPNAPQQTLVTTDWDGDRTVECVRYWGPEWKWGNVTNYVVAWCRAPEPYGGE